MIGRGNAVEADVTGGKHRPSSVLPIRAEVMALIMNDPAAIARAPFSPAARGYAAIYRDGEVNHCPGCGHTHWLIGRTTAECAFCATALPLEYSHR